MLKILMISTSYPTDYSPSDGVFFKEHAHAISIFNQIFLLSALPYHRYMLKQFPNIKIQSLAENNLHIKIILFPSITRKFDALLKIIIEIIYGMKIIRANHIDIIHVQKLFPAGFVGYILSRLYKKKLIATEHSSNFPMVLRTKLRKYFVLKTLDQCSKLIAVSKSLKRSIQETLGKRYDITVIGNPVNIQLFMPANDSKTNFNEILHVSSLNDSNKGITYLLKSINKLCQRRQDFMLSIIGGKNDLIKIYKAKAKELKIEKYVQFYGELPNEMIRNFMQKCAFLVLPSLHESFGVVLIEAMACGKPVIATKLGGPEEIVSNEAGLLIPPKDSEALSNAIDYMLNNCHLFNRDKIRKNIIDNYSYEIIGQKITDIYSSIN